MADTIVVTRHAGLVEYLKEKGLVDNDVPVISHATPDQIQGKHVIGVLPLQLAALADKVTIIPLKLSSDMRGKELSKEDVASVAGKPQTFQVNEVSGL